MAPKTATLTTTAQSAEVTTGRSRKLSFDEAFAGAVAQLPTLEPTHPDMLETVRVIEIGYLHGGIAGLRELYVRVSRTHD
jgi:hypothetical protein